MGDDADAPHAYSFWLAPTATLHDLFEHLANRHYLASVAGRNHRWQAHIGGTLVATILGNNPMPEPSEPLAHGLARYVQDGAIDLYFTYRSASS